MRKNTALFMFFMMISHLTLQKTVFLKAELHSKFFDNNQSMGCRQMLTDPHNFTANIATKSTTHPRGTLMRSSAIILTSIPPLPFCRLGQRFIYNHILYICHQYGPNLRGFRPFACTVKNEATSALVLKNNTYEDKNFLYKCIPGNSSLSYQAINCIFNNIRIKPGTFFRKGKTENSCQQDGEGFLKLVRKTALHDYCLSAGKNQSLHVKDCPGISIGADDANFGFGSEVIFDTQKKTIA